MDKLLFMLGTALLTILIDALEACGVIPVMASVSDANEVMTC